MRLFTQTKHNEAGFLLIEALIALLLLASLSIIISSCWAPLSVSFTATRIHLKALNTATDILEMVKSRTPIPEMIDEFSISVSSSTVIPHISGLSLAHIPRVSFLKVGITWQGKEGNNHELFLPSLIG